MTAPAINRSFIEDSKRIFLDRLTVDGQPLVQADIGNIDEGPGDEYDYAAVFNAFDFGVGADCSGLCGVTISAAIYGFAHMSWARLFSTETFDTWGAPLGFRQTTAEDLLNNNYAIKVWIMHGGGGPNSHMMCMIDGWQMESNGNYGTCTQGHGGTSLTDSMWNDWWVYDGPITEDTAYRTPTQYPRGLDYAGGAIPGANLVNAGIQFVMRYLTSGGAALPGKQLTAGEFQDLMNNGLLVGFNFETDATFMVEDNGAADATQALTYIRSLPGIPANAQPTVYFSADFDEAQTQDNILIAYLQAAAGVLGLAQTRLYGDYYICKRMMDAGVIGGFWQTEAWSSSQDGFHVDSRVGIVQRNNAGYQTEAGIQCDINEAHVDLSQLGLWGTAITAPAPPAPVAPPATPLPSDPFLAYLATASDADVLRYIAAQLGPGDPSWASVGMTARDKLWSLTPVISTPAIAAVTPAPINPPQVPVPGGLKK